MMSLHCDPRPPKYELVSGEMEKNPISPEADFSKEIVMAIRKTAFNMVKGATNKEGGPWSFVLATLLNACDIEVPFEKLLTVAMIIMHSTPGTVPVKSIMKIADS